MQVHVIDAKLLMHRERQQNNGNTKQVRQYISRVCVRVKEKENHHRDKATQNRSLFSYI